MSAAGKPALCGESRPHEPHRTTVAIGDGAPAGYAIADCPGIPALPSERTCKHGETTEHAAPVENLTPGCIGWFRCPGPSEPVEPTCDPCLVIGPHDAHWLPTDTGQWRCPGVRTLCPGEDARECSAPTPHDAFADLDAINAVLTRYGVPGRAGMLARSILSALRSLPAAPDDALADEIQAACMKGGIGYNSVPVKKELLGRVMAALRSMKGANR